MATEAAAAAEVGKGFHGSSTRKAFFRYPLLAYPNHVVVLTSRPRQGGFEAGRVVAHCTGPEIITSHGLREIG